MLAKSASLQLPLKILIVILKNTFCNGTDYFHGVKIIFQVGDRLFSRRENNFSTGDFNYFSRFTAFCYRTEGIRLLMASNRLFAAYL